MAENNKKDQDVENNAEQEAQQVNKPVADKEPGEEKENPTAKKFAAFRKKEAKEEQEIKELQEEIIKLTDSLTVAKNEYYKAYADADNTRKRLEQDLENRRKYMIQDFAIEILPAIDNLERALANADKESSLYVGVNMVLQQILTALKKEGVEEIVALGLPFDPNFHHAIMTEAREGVEPNMVIEVLQKGYKLKDRILRAALVKVSE